MDPFLGQLLIVGFNFAPNGWALCNGQIMSIAQNSALFALLGTTYGGNGSSTFGLPDLRGRFPLHPGSAPGLSPRSIGEIGGQENVSLISSQMPSHNHTLALNDGTSVIAGSGANAYLTSKTESGESIASASLANAVVANPASVNFTGGSQPHDNMPPYLGVNYIIALQGIFPSRP